ncbi:LacI family DNA-binding transcriptional regulator [Cognatishimia maritima]|uniref:Transcriptional regulator, LacI family n=1 Tax=Cognatishimia maritima TaxID=870908 RepID=A0A1M5N160_9RHOB|nr:substrate-binding domain-containing protein [Cognatishimia maritima]SHG82723.1 transcriptional regulator, LacI family [Cognatishimia maritima]
MNLKQLSELLGLSQTTVSRALNGYPEVNQKTRERVMEAARLHNYRPNTRAKGLATGRSMAIGHIIPVSTKHEMVNPVFGDFIAGTGETYSRNGYDMVLSVVADSDEEKAYRDMHRRGTVDGVIVHGPHMDDFRIQLLLELGMPFVVHGRASDISQPYSWVDVNNFSAFRRAANFLMDLGHRRIALINGLETMDFAYRRRRALDAALADRGLALDPSFHFQGEMTEVLGHDAMVAMLASDAPPTAVLVSSMITAIGVRRAVHEAGLKLGKDISLITHDDDLGYLNNGIDEPLFTATRSSVRDAGRRAAEMLLNMIETGATVPRTELLEADLIVGRSTGPVPSGG